MLGSLKNTANSIAAKAVDAVSDVSLDSMKGRITSTVDGTSAAVSGLAERVKDRVSDPAEAYDNALSDVLLTAQSAVYAGRGIEDVVEALRDGNPYRS